MTAEEIIKNEMQALLDRCPIAKDNAHPRVISYVSNTQFSVARYYGGMTMNGKTYIYDDRIDCLFRDDVWAWIQKELKAKRNKK